MILRIIAAALLVLQGTGPKLYVRRKDGPNIQMPYLAGCLALACWVLA